MDEPRDLAGLFVVKKKKILNGDDSDGSKAGKKSKLSEEFRDNEPESEEVTMPLKKSNLPLNSDRINEVGELDYSFNVKRGDDDRVFVEAATAVNEQDTEFDRDHLARRKETLERSRDLAARGQLDDKYRGLKGYQQFLMQNDTAKANAASDKNRIAGPVRAAANLRVTCRFDYKPDLCKDYNETGFCGFGDSCIFLHDRTEHKSSYQLDKEWEAAQKRKELDVENAEALIKTVTPDSKPPPPPSICAVCHKCFVRPVKTKCNHFFCEACVLKLKKCPTCAALLMGSFKPASKDLQIVQK